MMRLQEWLAENELTHGAFADQIGVSRTTITRLIGRGSGFTDDLIRKIIEGTGGMVTPNDFYKKEIGDAMGLQS